MMCEKCTYRNYFVSLIIILISFSFLIGLDETIMIQQDESKNSLGVPKSSDNQNLDWSQIWNTTSSDEGYGVAKDSQNNIIMMGVSDNATTGYDIVLVKYDKRGNQLWNTTWGGPDDEHEFSNYYSGGGGKVVVDTMDNIYVVGSTYSFGNGSSDVILIKFNSSGQQQWNCTWGTEDTEFGFDLALDPLEQYIYVVGQTNNNSGTNIDLALIKFNSSGNFEWNVTYGNHTGYTHEYGYGVAVDLNGDVYVIGHFRDTTSIPYDYAMILLKYNNTGDFQWKKYWYEDSMISGMDIIIDLNGDVCVTGYGPGGLVLGKYNTTGGTIFNFTWAPSNNIQAYGIAIDSENNIFVCGLINIPEADNSTIVKFNSTGSFLWEQNWGSSPRHDRGRAIILDDYDNIYIVGVMDDGATERSMFIYKYTNAPGSFLLSCPSGSPDYDGRWTLNWTKSKRAVNYTLFWDTNFISDYNPGLNLIAENVTNSSHIFNAADYDTYYFIAFAFNEYGNMSSNCITVIYEEETNGGPPDNLELGVPGFDVIILLLSSISITILFLQKKSRK